MKRLLILFVAIILTSCISTTPENEPTATATVSPEQKPGLEIAFNGVTWSQVWGKVYGIEGVVVAFKNSGTNIARVVWEKSSVISGSSSNIPFLDGMKYIDAGKPIPATMVPPGATIKRIVYSSSQPSYTSGKYGGWSMKPLPLNVQIVFCIDDGGESYYTMNVTGSL